MTKQSRAPEFHMHAFCIRVHGLNTNTISTCRNTLSWRHFPFFGTYKHFVNVDFAFKDKILTLCKLHLRIFIKTWQFSLTQSNKTLSWIRLLCKKPWKIPLKKPSEEAINKYRLTLFARYYSRKITRKYTF